MSKLIPVKSGGIFQGFKSFTNSTSKIASKLGPAGTLLTVGVMAYEWKSDSWDAHTIINGTLIVGAGVATFFAAPAVLTGIAIYGIADYTFDISGKIDSAIGRKSNIWDSK